MDTTEQGRLDAPGVTDTGPAEQASDPTMPNPVGRWNGFTFHAASLQEEGAIQMDVMYVLSQAGVAPRQVSDISTRALYNQSPVAMKARLRYLLDEAPADWYDTEESKADRKEPPRKRINLDRIFNDPMKARQVRGLDNAILEHQLLFRV